MLQRNRSKAAGRPGPRSGVAALEFGLLLPLMMLILLGAIDFGRFAHSYIATTNAARAGAGFATTTPFTPATEAAWQAELTQTVIDEMGAALASEGVEVPSPVVFVEGGGLRRFRVTVRLPFRTLVDWPGIPSEMTMVRQVEMRVIR